MPFWPWGAGVAAAAVGAVADNLSRVGLSSVADVTHADLRSLESEDDADHIDIRCRVCNGRISFNPDEVDPDQGVYACEGEIFVTNVFGSAVKKPHDLFWFRLSVDRATENGLRSTFYVVLPDVEPDLLKLDVAQTTKAAYHILRPATIEERWEEAHRRLGVLRSRVRPR